MTTDIKKKTRWSTTADLPAPLIQWAEGPFLLAFKRYTLAHARQTPNSVNQLLLAALVLAAGVVGCPVPREVLEYAWAACGAAGGRKPSRAALEGYQPGLFDRDTVTPSGETSAPATPTVEPQRPGEWVPLMRLLLGTYVVNHDGRRLDLHGKRSLSQIAIAAFSAGWTIDATDERDGLAGVRFVPPREHVPSDGSFRCATETHPEEPPPPSPRSCREGARPLDDSATHAARNLETIPPAPEAHSDTAPTMPVHPDEFGGDGLPPAPAVTPLAPEPDQVPEGVAAFRAAAHAQLAPWPFPDAMPPADELAAAEQAIRDGHGVSGLVFPALDGDDLVDCNDAAYRNASAWLARLVFSVGMPSRKTVSMPGSRGHARIKATPCAVVAAVHAQDLMAWDDMLQDHRASLPGVLYIRADASAVLEMRAREKPADTTAQPRRRSKKGGAS